MTTTKQGRMDTLRPKILAMEKSGQSLTQIAKELKLSNSYVWVIARKYVFNPDKAKKRTRTNGKAKTTKAAKLTKQAAPKKAASSAPVASADQKAAAL